MTFEARQSWRHVVEDLLVKASGAGVFGYGAWLFTSRPADELGGGWPVLVVRAIGVALGVTAVFCAVEAVTRVVQASRRQLVVRVDAEGVTLGPRWFWSAPVAFCWRSVAGVSLASAGRPGSGAGDAGRPADRVRVTCRDGRVHRRRLDLRRLGAPGAPGAAAGPSAGTAAGMAEALVALAPDGVLLSGVERPRRAA